MEHNHSLFNAKLGYNVTIGNLLPKRQQEQHSKKEARVNSALRWNTWKCLWGDFPTNKGHQSCFMRKCHVSLMICEAFECLMSLLKNKITTIHPSWTAGLLSLLLSPSATCLEVWSKGTCYKSSVSAPDPKHQMPLMEVMYWLMLAKLVRWQKCYYKPPLFNFWPVDKANCISV